MSEKEVMAQVANPQVPLEQAPVLENEEALPRPENTTTNLRSPGINIELHSDSEDRDDRKGSVEHLSAPAPQQQYQSPIRQHKRTPSAHRLVKETLNARSEYTNDDQDGRSHHRINQYVIKEEIGRGSYGAVHLAVDQYGNEYAVKEFSKARLRKRAQSNILRLGPRGPWPSRSPMRGLALPGAVGSRMSDQKANEAKDALFLIREETAIMKKLNHPNLVQLFEVLDDPDEDSLYMVLEMCKKGVIMKVGLNEPAKPYPAESCRCWFRDLILGIEYLHYQGVVHRDIKPDNLLLTEDDVLKIVDFGVSEMFETSDVMRTSKSAGSPAFIPPELCVAKHGDVSGKAADIWSMGVSLYCLRYGRLPFERDSILDVYEAIKTEEVELPPGENEDFVDLMSRILEKDPEKRINMEELREHPWVTKGGEDALLSAEENCVGPVDLPNALELNHAFTRKMSHLLCVMKAIAKFKGLLAQKGATKEKAIGEEAPRQPVSSRNDIDQVAEEDSVASHAARVLRDRERFLSARGGHGSPEGKGHAQDSASSTGTELLFLGIGTGGQDDFTSGKQPSVGIVAESPTAVDFNVYDRAFEAEVDRIKRSTSTRGSRRGTGNMYLTKHLNEKERYETDDTITWMRGSSNDTPSTPAQQIPIRFVTAGVSQTVDTTKEQNRLGSEA